VSAGAPSAAVPLPPVSPAPPPTASQQPSAPPPVNAAPQTAPASTATAALPPAPPEGGIPSVPEAPAATAADAPRVYGVSNGPSRITIRATADSWIQIREGGSAQARVLKPGESYRVPDRPGITMRTGNAGGIEILVDGKQAPPLGPMGKPRNAVLDPARLLAGTAIGE
jgi:cytoskeleton protein RodZ